MKKIKKIFPLLLSVMVLMFGSLTVCAAENIGTYTPRESDKTKIQNLFAYAESQGINVNNKYYIYVNQTGTPYMYIADSIGTVTVRESDGQIIITLNNGYRIESSYFRTSSQADMPKHTFCTNFNYSDSNLSLVANKDGFFPIPPVGKLAVKLTEVVTNQAKIIIPIAVGCLALLVGLILSTKLLRKFLN